MGEAKNIYFTCLKLNRWSQRIMSNIKASESTEPKKSSEVNLEEEAASEEPDQPWEPTTSDDVLQYLRENLVNSFADADFRQSLLFEDALEGVSGAHRLAVAESLWDGKPCFVVEGHSRGIANGVKWNSVLTATVEIPTLGTVRQKRIFKAESCVEGSVGDEPLDAVECLTNVEMLKRPYTPVEEPPILPLSDRRSKVQENPHAPRKPLRFPRLLRELQYAFAIPRNQRIAPFFSNP